MIFSPFKVSHRQEQLVNDKHLHVYRSITRKFQLNEHHGHSSFVKIPP